MVHELPGFEEPEAARPVPRVALTAARSSEPPSSLNTEARAHYESRHRERCRTALRRIRAPQDAVNKYSSRAHATVVRHIHGSRSRQPGPSTTSLDGSRYVLSTVDGATPSSCRTPSWRPLIARRRHDPVCLRTCGPRLSGNSSTAVHARPAGLTRATRCSGTGSDDGRPSAPKRNLDHQQSRRDSRSSTRA